MTFYEPADIMISIKDKGVVLKEKSLVALNATDWKVNRKPFEPLMAKATRFLGIPYECTDIDQANPIVPTVFVCVILRSL